MKKETNHIDHVTIDQIEQTTKEFSSSNPSTLVKSNRDNKYTHADESNYMKKKINLIKKECNDTMKALLTNYF